MNKEVLLETKDIKKLFATTVALNGVSLQLFRGEIRGLIGENGSGKSTLSSIIVGIHQASEGEIFFKGQRFKSNSMTEALANGIGMIVQETGTIANISIAENMFLGNLNQFIHFGFVNKKKLIQEARKALHKMGIEDINPALPMSSLNFQDRKLIEIAKVYYMNPDILIVDETTTALSQTGRKIIYNIMNQMKNENKAVLFISHDLDELMDICDSMTILRDGSLIENLFKEDFEEDRIKMLMVGREMNGSFYRTDFDGSYSDEAALIIEGACMGKDLIDFSMTLHRGEILGIGGLSHCGMHALGKVLFGFEKLSRGTVTHGPSGDKIDSPINAIRHNIGYVSKDRDSEALVLAASIRDNISITGFEQFASNSFFISSKAETKYVKKQVELLNIKCSGIDQFVQFLSGGNKQKVVFGKWIGRKSEILLLDCPTRGVDIGVKAAMYQLMYEMKMQGKAILIISEELPELIGMSDRLLIMKDGVKTAEYLRSRDLSEAMIIQHMI